MNFIPTPFSRLAHHLCSLACGLALIGCQTVWAATPYPDRPITLVVAYAPGGGVDTMGRVLARELGNILKQSVIIDNRPGAGGSIGASYVAQAAPDGYTLFVGDVALITTPYLMKKVPYNWAEDFEPISGLSAAPLVLTVPVSSPIKSLSQLIDLGKKTSGGLTFSSAGIGSTPHLAGELLKIRSKGLLTHVPYKGSGPAMLDLIAGRLDFAFSSIAAARPFIAQDKLRVLGTTGTERSLAFQEFQTVAETVPDFKVIFWTGLLAPSKTSSEIIKKLNDSVRLALASELVQEELKKTGESTNYLTTKQSKEFFADESKRWGNVISEAKIQLD